MAFEIKQNRRERENKTIRFPIEVIEKVKEAITGKDVSFSNFVIQAVSYALENMEKQNHRLNRWFVVSYHILYAS